MNIIETLPKTFDSNGIPYTLCMHVTAFGKLCIYYREMIPHNDGSRKILCSVCVEPENEPVKIEDTIGTFNDYVGNARTLDDAAEMLKTYVETVYIKRDTKINNFWDYINTLEDGTDKWRYAIDLGKKFHDNGKDPNEYIEKIISEVETKY
jgi:hypothetical protein